MELLRQFKIIAIISIFIIATAGYAVAAETAETLVDSIQNGKVGLEAKIWYQTNDSDANKHMFSSENSYFDAGLRLGYITDTYKGFAAAVNFYAVDDLSAYENWANKSMMNVDHKDTGSWLGEAYLSYTSGNTNARLGRQNIKSPLVNSDEWALFPNNFEALMVTNADIANTKLVGGYIWKERYLKSQDFEDFHDDLFMLGVVNNSLEDIELSGYFYYADKDDGYIGTGSNDETLATYLEAKTKFKTLNLGAQFIRIDPDQDGTTATNAFAAKVSTTLGKVDVYGAYAYVGDGYYEAAKLSDKRIKTPIYTKTIAGDGDISGRPDTQGFVLCASMKPLEDLKLMGRIGYYRFDDADDYRKPDERRISDNDGSQYEVVCSYTGIEYVTLYGALWYSNHEGVGGYNGKNDEDLISFRFWARFMF